MTDVLCGAYIKTSMCRYCNHTHYIDGQFQTMCPSCGCIKYQRDTSSGFGAWVGLWVCVFLYATWYAFTARGWFFYLYLAVVTCGLIYAAVNLVREAIEFIRNLFAHPARTLFWTFVYLFLTYCFVTWITGGGLRLNSLFP